MHIALSSGSRLRCIGAATLDQIIWSPRIPSYVRVNPVNESEVMAGGALDQSRSPIPSLVFICN